MTPRQLSHELREGRSPDLTRRRWVIGLSLVGAAMAKAVTLYQTGIIRRLPDPPLPGIDSSKVDASDYAYRWLQTPDGVMMLANYAATAWLAAAGGKDRARSRPLLPIASAAKALADSVLTLKLAREEWDENRALCAYCQVATACSIASAALALPEAIAASRHLAGTRPSAVGRAAALVPTG